MKYISHLDLHRLFKRSLKKAGISTDYSKGFNPHEIVNIVQPLSLGFESESEYFEFETPDEPEMSEVISSLNLFMPAGIKLTAVRKIPHSKKNLSVFSEFASYRVVIPCSVSVSETAASDFMMQDQIMVYKRDKKTKEYVLKDVKSMVRSIRLDNTTDKALVAEMCLSCASNQNLNPLNLAESLCRFCGIEADKNDISVTRLDIYGSKNGNPVSLFDYYGAE